MQTEYGSLNDFPTYGISEAAFYLRLSYGLVRNWTLKSGLLEVNAKGLLSFNDLLELHVLKGLRRVHGLSLPRIRAALEQYQQEYATRHPLLDPRFETDGISLFLHQDGNYINMNRSKQLAIPAIVSTYMRRIVTGELGERHFFPFIVEESNAESKSVQISPTIAFGKPVLAGTGISTEVVAGRFLARDSVAELAEEYQVDQAKIEEAIRWELPHIVNAAA